MPRLSWTALLVCLGLVVSAALYTYQLEQVPAYLTLDEAHFSVHAESIARSGRNLNGQLLPPLISLADPEGERFVLPWGTTYYLPLGMYLIAGALQVLPLNEATVRTPSALLGGVVNVGLIFALALALYRNRVAAAASAAVLALAPANLILSRQALDSVCQLPFVLGGLWCLATYLRAPDPRLALAAGVIFGCGIYAYITSVMLMPVYLALFWLIGWRGGVLDRRAALWSIAGFAIALLPMGLWLMTHPEAARSLLLQYNRADPGSPTLLQTLAGGGLGAALADTVRIYWSYFDPTFLFIQGGNARNLSTGEVGVFLYPVALLAPIGIYHLRHHRLARMLLVTGLLVAPIPAVIKGAPYAIQRASGLLVFISLLAGIGLAAIAGSARTMARAAAAAMVFLMVWQFSSFYRDYGSRYRIASSYAYDPTAFREAAELIMRSDAERVAQSVYLPANFYDVGAKWRFYTIKHDRVPLWHRTRYFNDRTALGAAPTDSIALMSWAETNGQVPEGWSSVGVVNSLGGEPTAIVIRRHP